MSHTIPRAIKRLSHDAIVAGILQDPASDQITQGSSEYDAFIVLQDLDDRSSIFIIDELGAIDAEHNGMKRIGTVAHLRWRIDREPELRSLLLQHIQAHHEAAKHARERLEEEIAATRRRHALNNAAEYLFKTCYKLYLLLEAHAAAIPWYTPELSEETWAALEKAIPKS